MAATQTTRKKELFDGNGMAPAHIAAQISDAEAALTEYSADREVAALQLSADRKGIYYRDAIAHAHV